MNLENATREELLSEVQRLTEECGRLAEKPGIDAVPLPVFSKDLRGKYLFCNPAFEAFCGRSRSDIVGKTIDDLVPSESAAVYKEKDNELLLRGKGIIHYESMLRDATGRSRSILIYKSLILDPLGNPQQITGTVHEVTALRETELSLEQLRERVHGIIEAADEPIWAIDISRKITLCNRAFASVIYAMYGTSASSGRGIDDLVPSVSFPRENKYWKDLLEKAMQGNVFSHEFSYVMENELQHMIITCYPVRSGDILTGMAFFSKMVTQVRQAEERALEASEFKKKILEASPIGIAVFNSAGVCLSVNRSFAEIIGAPVPYLTGKNFHDIVQWKQNGLGSAAESSMRSGNSERVVLHTPTMNGRKAWFDCRFVPFQSIDGKNLLLLISDITENRQIEEDTKHIMHELKQSNAELERFAYVASHDLQEPLRVIASYLQLIERKYSDKLDDKGRDFIARTVGGAKRMQGMIEDLLAYSRVMTRGGAFSSVSLSDAFSDALKNLGIAIRKSKADIQCEDLPQVYADRSQMTRLFQNLIGNAIKFCDKDRPRIRITCKAADCFWSVSVHDNGIGIQEEFYDRIFNVFQRLHSIEQYSGSGIGLAVCQRIVERHGGVLSVKSVPGEGSIFTFTIPRERI